MKCFSRLSSKTVIERAIKGPFLISPRDFLYNRMNGFKWYGGFVYKMFFSIISCTIRNRVISSHFSNWAEMFYIVA
jgi:hypothetical protein